MCGTCCMVIAATYVLSARRERPLTDLAAFVANIPGPGIEPMSPPVWLSDTSFIFNSSDSQVFGHYQIWDTRTHTCTGIEAIEHNTSETDRPALCSFSPDGRTLVFDNARGYQWSGDLTGNGAIARHIHSNRLPDSA